MAGPKIYQIRLGRFIARMSHQGKKRLDLWLCIIQGDRSLEKNICLWMEIEAQCNMSSNMSGQKYVKYISCNGCKYPKILLGQCQPPCGRVFFINFY